jgi:hypothetical protein
VHEISQIIGNAANPGGRVDGNRKQHGFRALTAISVGVSRRHAYPCVIVQEAVRCELR